MFWTPRLGWLVTVLRASTPSLLRRHLPRLELELELELVLVLVLGPELVKQRAVLALGHHCSHRSRRSWRLT